MRVSIFFCAGCFVYPVSMNVSPASTPLLHDVDEAARRLIQGQIVAFPTETVYGLGANALQVRSVARIFEAKRRPSFDPLIVHVADIPAAERLTTSFSHTARRLAEAFWPGPLTLVLPRTEEIPDLVTAGLPGVGIRIPDHPLARRLLESADCPLAAPSANPFGGVSPTTAQHVLDGLGGRIDGVLDGGPCRVGLESTVVSLMDRVAVVLRPGGLPVEDIERIVGPVRIATSDPAQDDSAQPAPGMLSRHYAPRTLLQVFDGTPPESAPDSAALLTWGHPTAADDRFSIVRRLSETNDLHECAANLFAALRSLDAGHPDVIIARRFPNIGLGRALNDRLQRAACR